MQDNKPIVFNTKKGERKTKAKQPFKKENLPIQKKNFNVKRKGKTNVTRYQIVDLLSIFSTMETTEPSEEEFSFYPSIYSKEIVKPEFILNPNFAIPPNERINPFRQTFQENIRPPREIGVPPRRNEGNRYQNFHFRRSEYNSERRRRKRHYDSMWFYKDLNDKKCGPERLGKIVTWIGNYYEDTLLICSIEKFEENVLKNEENKGKKEKSNDEKVENKLKEEEKFCEWVILKDVLKELKLGKHRKDYNRTKNSLDWNVGRRKDDRKYLEGKNKEDFESEEFWEERNISENMGNIGKEEKETKTCEEIQKSKVNDTISKIWKEGEEKVSNVEVSKENVVQEEKIKKDERVNNSFKECKIMDKPKQIGVLQVNSEQKKVKDMLNPKKEDISKNENFDHQNKVVKKESETFKPSSFNFSNKEVVKRVFEQETMEDKIGRKFQNEKKVIFQSNIVEEKKQQRLPIVNEEKEDSVWDNWGESAIWKRYGHSTSSKSGNKEPIKKNTSLSNKETSTKIINQPKKASFIELFNKNEELINSKGKEHTSVDIVFNSPNSLKVSDNLNLDLKMDHKEIEKEIFLNTSDRSVENRQNEKIIGNENNVVGGELFNNNQSLPKIPFIGGPGIGKNPYLKFSKPNMFSSELPQQSSSDLKEEVRVLGLNDGKVIVSSDIEKQLFKEELLKNQKSVEQVGNSRIVVNSVKEDKKENIISPAENTSKQVKASVPMSQQEKKKLRNKRKREKRKMKKMKERQERNQKQNIQKHSNFNSNDGIKPTKEQFLIQKTAIHVHKVQPFVQKFEPKPVQFSELQYDQNVEKDVPRWNVSQGTRRGMVNPQVSLRSIQSQQKKANVVEYHKMEQKVVVKPPTKSWNVNQNRVKTNQPLSFKNIISEQKKQKKGKKSRIEFQNEPIDLSMFYGNKDNKKMKFEWNNLGVNTQPSQKPFDVQYNKRVPNPVPKNGGNSYNPGGSTWGSGKLAIKLSTNRRQVNPVQNVYQEQPKRNILHHQHPSPQQGGSNYPTQNFFQPVQSYPPQIPQQYGNEFKKGFVNNNRQQKKSYQDPQMFSHGSNVIKENKFRNNKIGKKTNLQFGLEEDVSDDFKKWYKIQMKEMGKVVVDNTLMYFLISLKNDKEVDDYIFKIIGNNDRTKRFAEELKRFKSFEISSVSKVSEKKKKNKRKKKKKKKNQVKK